MARPEAMTVIFVAFQTDNKANGGIESLGNLIAGASAINRVVITDRESPFTQGLERKGVTVIFVNLGYTVARGIWRDGLKAFFSRVMSIVEVNWLILRVRFKSELKAVHCNDPAPFWHVAPMAKILGAQLLLNLRDTKGSAERLSLIKYMVYFVIADRILVLSSEMVEFYREKLKFIGSILRDKVHFIYSIVNFDRFYYVAASERREMRARLQVNPTAFAIGVIAAFNSKKNQLQFIQEAVPLILEGNRDAQIFFVGDFVLQTGNYADRCAAAADRFGDRVKFIGFTPEVDKWYAALDVVVVPTIKEGLARCMIEAISRGTSVVSFDVCSAREILIDHGCGFVVKQADYSTMAKCVLSLSDVSLRAEMGRRGSDAAVSLFDERSAIRRYLEFCKISRPCNHLL